MGKAITPLSIVNSYGNVDLVNGKMTKRYVHIKGQRLGPLCRKLGIRFAQALVAWGGSKQYPRPRFDGVVISARSAPKLMAEIEARAARNPEGKRQNTLAARQAKAAEKESKLDALADRIGYLRGGRIEKALLAADIGEEEAELKAFKAAYRHNYTDYDDHFSYETFQEYKQIYGFEDAKEMMREDARNNKIESPIPETWPEYLDKYGFDSAAAIAMAKVLKSPKAAHPCWFKEREIALRGKPLDNLTYEAIRDA